MATAEVTRGKKRARPVEPQPKEPKSEDAGSHVSGKRRKAKAAAARKEEEADLDLEAGLNKALERMDGPLLADHIAQKMKRFDDDLTTVELADLYIPGNLIKDISSWRKPRSTANLPNFLEHLTPAKKLSQAPQENGTPHTIIVTGAGLRAADLVRSVRKYQNAGNIVAKLFAKHIKLEEAVAFLGKTRAGIAVGTPQRVMDLLDNKALSVDKLERIIVDASHIDIKKRGVLDMKETLIPLLKLLSRKEFKERYGSAGGKLKHDTNNDPLDLVFY